MMSTISLDQNQAVTPATPRVSGISWRRAIFTALTIGTMVPLLVLMAWSLLADGFHTVDAFIFVFFFLTLPWTVIGFWNAVIGFGIMRGSKDPVAAVAGDLVQPSEATPITAKTALLQCIRNEDVSRVTRNLDVMIEELIASGEGGAFSAHILSDTTWEDVAEEEEVAIARLQARWRGRFDIHYRRRTENSAFKAGNIREFLESPRNVYEFAIVLDADSYMSAPAMLRMVRIMQANPHVGILQSLMAGLPTISPFARIFQFGMRLGMKSYTLGSAWWQGDCGPYWGHNAVLRVAPFRDHCHLPYMEGEGPLKGYVLSHDQVEATLMRRAGYHVRVLPIETGSYEENPTHILEFMRRDLRWCQGNMQYINLLNLPGLLPLSRLQLLLAIMMFVSSFAWMMFVAFAAVGLPLSGGGFAGGPGIVLMATVMTMVFAPKLATILDVLLRPSLFNRYGGRVRVLVSSFLEIVFSMILAPIVAFSTTVFIIMLFFGRGMGWPAQRRAVHSLSFGEATHRLWGQTVAGVIGLAWIASVTPHMILPAMPILGGLLLAIPFAVGSSQEGFGKLLARLGISNAPEEKAPTPAIRELGLPALSIDTDIPARLDFVGAETVEEVKRAA